MSLSISIRNDAWVKAFPHCSVTHLSRLKLDHRPLLLSLTLVINFPRRSPFRFLAGWVEHPNLSNFVKDNWHFNGNMFEALASFTSNIKVCNKYVYRHINIRKRKLMQKLFGI